MKSILLIVTILLVCGFVFLCNRAQKSDLKIGAFSFLVIGMLIGLLGGFQIFWGLDNTKGWNPYGWWLLASFATTVIGGLVGVVIFGKIAKKKAIK
ncbi:hypothetical protein G3N55_10730 [Dissulfurirhabdus thermomarina]|uniref:Uncharacterized protein n=1 Tax=Dissulfurirhabdus thermomarina TaxID=1765737 RepID=A0A6N9TT98_DISTH|nr:hypothetical protein [Dissulfurirhabdus thermomarina]NDY43313.1 hypothetical protein [Dissulfurirhabdus thermomarina]NMX23475.1 hypothetical protein [Dissulfurirhabdus thermomarina]